MGNQCFGIRSEDTSPRVRGMSYKKRTYMRSRDHRTLYVLWEESDDEDTPSPPSWPVGFER
jgi:hypothetical protein